MFFDPGPNLGLISKDPTVPVGLRSFVILKPWVPRFLESELHPFSGGHPFLRIALESSP
jgi:hypothetical protein